MKVVLASPRGFCAGVNMAIESLRLALERLGPPIYVYHEIVHNRYVVDSFGDQGAHFVDEIEEVPQGATLLFSAHGVAPEIREAARRQNLKTIDATCPSPKASFSFADGSSLRNVMPHFIQQPDAFGRNVKRPKVAATGAVLKCLERAAKRQVISALLSLAHIQSLRCDEQAISRLNAFEVSRNAADDCVRTARRRTGSG